MKKKIIIITVVSSILLTGVVSAASMWGSYKGNDIIRITSNGAALRTTDVPAISYNSRTMIPISMLGQIGIVYNWDQTNKTVDITKQSSSDGNSTEMLKNYVKIADYYNRLKSLGDMIANLSNGYSLVYNEIHVKGTNSYYSTMNTILNEVINLYNTLQTESLSYNNSVMNDILIDYYSAIDYFKSADKYITLFFGSRSNENFNEYLNSSSEGFNIADSSRKKALTNYQNIISLILK